jgi:molybdopterin converting factor small subunit
VSVEVRLFATLAQFLPPGSHDGSAVLDVSDEVTIADLVQRLGIPPGFDRVLLLNGVEAEPEARVRSGDVVDIFPPLAGGATRAYPAPRAGSGS